MFNRKKIGSKPSVAKPANRLFRLLRSEVAYRASPVSLERKGQEQFCYESRKAIEDAMLQAEYNRAKALMTSQQARSFY